MSALTVENLSVEYDKKPILKNLSLEIKKDEIFGLIGCNGSGKTTFIRSALGLTKIKFGEVNIFSENPKSLEARKHFNYLPEKFMPMMQLTGWEYIKSLHEFYDIPLDENQICYIARKLDFEPRDLSKSLRKLSKGMQQKIGLIGAFALDREFLILDEPMSGLDPLARVRLKDYLLEYKKEHNAIFFSSHILADVAEICNRIGVLKDGELIYVGDTDKFIRQYKGENLERAFINALTPDFAVDLNYDYTPENEPDLFEYTSPFQTL